ncbi:MAG: DNA-3-methyladenine glycosylase I [Lysinibacillus sp.]
MKRCAWVKEDEPLYVKYHDEEWGRPVHDDRLLFEMLCLEGAQAGLSWWTILQKRENYRKAFDFFEAEKIIHYSEEKIQELLNNPGIVRNRLKVRGVVKNAKAFLAIREEFGSFNDFIWRYTEHKTIYNQWKSIREVPTTSPISDLMSKDLKKRGFTFVGSTICYSYMQAVGMVNDHTMDCFCYSKNR